jgi:hypothetical protein
VLDLIEKDDLLERSRTLGEKLAGGWARCRRRTT